MGYDRYFTMSSSSKNTLKRAQQRQIVDHASKEIFVNHFKIISSQDENVRDEAIEKGWI